MKKSNKTIRIVLCTIFMIAFFSSRVWAIALSFEESASTINIGESIEIDLVISGLENNNLAAFDFNVNFDDSILDFNSYSLGTGLGTGWDISDFSLGYLGAGSCNVHLSEFSWLWDFTFQPDSFTLATLTFTGAGVGTSPLSFSDVLLSDDGWLAQRIVPSNIKYWICRCCPSPRTWYPASFCNRSLRVRAGSSRFYEKLKA